MKDGELKEYFVPVTAVHKTFKFKGERHIEQIEARWENVHPVIVGFDGDVVMVVHPGQVVNLEEGRWTRELHMRRGQREKVIT